MAQRRSPSSRKSTAKSTAQSKVKSKSIAARPKAKTAKAAAPKTKAKTKATTKAGAKKAAPRSKIKAKAKLKSAPKSTKTTPKAARPVARRTARAVQGRKPTRKPGGRTERFATPSKAGKVGVETRPQEMDVGKRGPGFVYEEQPRQSSDESLSPGNYQPGQVGEAKMSPRPRGVANRGGGSETETPADTNPRAATDGSAREEQGAFQDHGKAE